MGLLILLVILILGSVAIFPFLVGGVAVAARNGEKSAKANAPTILDSSFDGRDDVVFKITMASLPFEDVVIGAKERGYRLASQSSDDRWGGKTLIFERDDR